MRSIVVGVAIFLAAVPAWGSHCRKRVVVQKVIRQEVIVQKIYQPAAIYAAPPPVQVTAQAIAPYYQPIQQQQVCCVPVCCPTIVAPGAGALPPGQAPQPGGPSNPPAGAAELDEQAQAIFTKACISCHSGQNPKTALDLRDLRTLTSAQCKDTALRVQLGEMPPENPAEKVSDEEAQLLMKWAKTK